MFNDIKVCLGYFISSARGKKFKLPIEWMRGVDRFFPKHLIVNTTCMQAAFIAPLLEGWHVLCIFPLQLCPPSLVRQPRPYGIMESNKEKQKTSSLPGLKPENDGISSIFLPFFYLVDQCANCLFPHAVPGGELVGWGGRVEDEIQ